VLVPLLEREEGREFDLLQVDRDGRKETSAHGGNSATMNVVRLLLLSFDWSCQARCSSECYHQTIAREKRLQHKNVSLSAYQAWFTIEREKKQIRDAVSVE
jgi:hypothetical protein